MIASLYKRHMYWIQDFFFNKGAVKKNITDIRLKLDDASKYYVRVNSGTVEELRNILTYAVRNTAYYSGLAPDASLEEFPVVNKSLLNENYDKILVPAYRNIRTHKMHTSGSTGIPFTVIQNMKKRDRHIADLKYFGALAGYQDHDPMCYLRAKPTATPKDQKKQNIWQLDICNLTEENLTEYYKIMVSKKCTTLMAYPSTLETAITCWADKFHNQSSIKTIISTSETLTSKTRNKLKDFFGERCTIYARYSNTENGIMGQECSEEGIYKLNWASYYFEFLQLDRDEPAQEGELSRIIITDLYNKAFPMIRYDTGDVAKTVRQKDGFPYLSHLYGRRMDLIYDTKHDVVSPFLLCRTMRLSHGIEQWQFIQNSETGYILRITVTHGEKPTCEKEISSFKNVLGQNADIKIEYVSQIPIMSSMKRKLIVSNLKR